MSELSATGEWPKTPSSAAVQDWPGVPGYKARQISLKRLVALKVIRDGALAGPQERARFRIEAEAAARMHHPNIVQIFEAGEHQGRPYFAMELVEGGSLDKQLGGQPQPARDAAGIIRTLALAVQHAHQQQIIHRDLKPANILMQSASPKITDFGLAKRLDNESTVATQDGVVLGTAAYMAPEQAAGRVREIGPPTDIYALGVILYELLTGRPPFQADSWHRTVEKVLNDEPTPPTSIHTGLPCDLETICLKCLEKTPARRYGSAGELADDLSRFLEGQSVAAVPLSAKERLARLAARDGYVLGEVIGSGPRTTVYRAQFGPLKQPVAVKVFTAGLCTREEWDAQLRRRTEMWAALAHPQIVAVQQAGWWDGAPYVATEYIPQGSLDIKPGGRLMPLRQSLRTVEQLAEIVSYLHRQGIIHGNLKPSNVLYAADAIPRVVDSYLTGGLFQGSLPVHDADPAAVGYLAPELAHDRHEDPGINSDIYGLGLILYELLTGRPPFVAANAWETLELVGSQEPIPPSQLNAAVNSHLEGVCLRCLRKNPWRRYYRVYDLLTRLRHFQENPDGSPLSGSSRSNPFAG
jgi:eukaryotic-like serine/threonine-protein kinase